MPHVYIIKIGSDSYYIGSTSNINRRMLEHKRGKKAGTKFSKDVELVFTQEFDTIKEAIGTEKKLKKYKNKNIIKKIIEDGKINKVN